ncbi:hypothetical protein HK097_010268 [Rhizophlyctis rosea]|uniref:Ankyrin n=1 Tax=Rhizophlyctis rosea TaxID=64517 RepID=A0AAD5SAG6_9FUNG|nr:hypothetical protein HK097_010268 [Rhizophlyctis rosea]
MNSCISAAAKTGDVALTSFFLAAAGYNLAPADLYLPLFNAISISSKGIVKPLLDRGADSKTEVRTAAEVGNIEIVEMLLNAGGDLDDAMYEAAASNHVDLVTFLLDRGANIDTGLYGAVAGPAMEFSVCC